MSAFSWKWIAIAYGGIILLIIAIANHSAYSGLLTFVHAIPYGDKIGHFVLIGVLALVVNLGWQCATFQWGRIKILKGSLVVFICVVLEEFSQLFIATRTFDIGDLMADVLGIVVLGSLAIWIHAKLKPAPRQNLENEH